MSMKRNGGLFVLIAILIGCQQKPIAIYGEIPQLVDGFALKPGEKKTFGPTSPDGGHIRYEVKSSLPLTVGVSTSPAANEQEPAGWCWESQTLSTKKDCVVPDNDQKFVLVTDLRTAKDISYGRLGNLGYNPPSVPENFGSVTIYRWGCIKNCP